MDSQLNFSRALNVSAVNASPISSSSAASSSGGESGIEMITIVIYIFLFALGAPSNLCVFCSLLRKKRNLRSKITKLLLHLSIADLIVTWIMIPMEIIWGITNQWLAGDLMCRILQILRALGPYLSSAILISISIDRYYAIVYPLRFTSSRKRMRLMLVLSWSSSLLISLPQGFVFSVKTHPKDPNFSQCIALGFFQYDWQEKVYNIFCLFPLYFLPLITIVWCYSFIYFAAQNRSRDATLNPELQLQNMKPRNTLSPAHDVEETELTDIGALENGTSSTSSMPSKQQLSANYESANSRFTSKIEDARRQVLKITLTIVSAFVVCWTPYVLMALWWQIHEPSAQAVNKVLRNVLFLFAVSNSVVNPYLYGGFSNPFRNPFRGR